MEKFLNLILPEEAFESDNIIATYFYRSRQNEDVYEKAKRFAIGQTVGTWVPIPGITSKLLNKYGGKIVNIYDIPPIELTTDLSENSFHIIQIAFPDENYIPQIPMLLTTLLGNDISTSLQVKLIDIKFSKNFLSYFKGPKFGIDGIYNYLNVKEKRPLILNMIKPCLGYTPNQGAEIFKSLAMGGIDIIKDDELFANTSYSSIEDRVKAYRKASQEIYEKTGHKTAFCVNITDRPDKMIENAYRAIDAGASMLMINFITTGIGSLQAIAEDPNIKVPILAHFASAGSLTESPYCGISTPLLLGKLVRLAGADMCLFSSPYSNYPFLKARYIQIANCQRLPLWKIKPTMPVIGGGVHPGNVENIVNDLGKEIVLAPGGAILGHPLGPTEGAKAMMQAVKALGKGLKLNEASKLKSYEALKTALEIWK